MHTTARAPPKNFPSGPMFSKMECPAAINLLAEDKDAIQNRRCEVVIDSVHRWLLAGLIVPCHRLWKQSP